ncbi:voltage-gated chloride channel family protein [Nostoc sp.]
MFASVFMKQFRHFEPFIALPHLIKWLPISIVVGILAGTASAALLASLEWATDWRESHQWIVALLPLGGFLSGWIYHQFGRTVEGGNNLLLEEIHNPKSVIPFRMAPLVLLGTDLTHFFGGSAGREGTALQMGASLADQLTKILHFQGANRRILLTAGISGGFASVFGTPLAGTVFGLEVLAIGKIHYDALFPSLIAAIVGNQVTLLFGLHHTAYRHAPSIPTLTIWGLISAIIAGAIFGIVARFFAKLTHQISHFFKAKISYPPMRPFIGGAMIAVIVGLSGTTKYIGLGIPTIVDSFFTQLPPWDFAAKLGLTALTLGAGFKGGEVTPLFFIGATLGNALSLLLALPAPLLAGMGFVGVFAGAANTPLASTLMGIELFGLESGIFIGIGCIVSYLFSGHSGIYSSQRIGLSKYSTVSLEEGVTLANYGLEKVEPKIGLRNDGEEGGNNS